MQAAREESGVLIFGETLLKPERAADQSVCRESAEAIVPPNRTTPAGRAESGAGNRPNLRAYSSRTKNPWNGGGLIREMERVQVPLHITEWRNWQGVWRRGVAECGRGASPCQSRAAKPPYAINGTYGGVRGGAKAPPYSITVWARLPGSPAAQVKEKAARFATGRPFENRVWIS